MSDGLVPLPPQRAAVSEYVNRGDQEELAPELPPRNAWERPLAAARRYKWLMLVVASLFTGAGALGIRYLKPQYEVHATIWLQTETPQNREGPIRSRELLASSAWTELFKSYRVVDAVVRDLTLYLRPEKSADRPLFQGFDLKDEHAPGQYELEIDGSQQTWVLRKRTGEELERGSATDSVGAKRFRWLLPATAFRPGLVRKVRFTVLQPREASTELINHLGTNLKPGSNFLGLTYQNPDGELAARTLNTWLSEFVTVAADLKKHNMVEFSKILESQLMFAQQNLFSAQKALEDFRVQTITLPAEAGPAAAGVELTRDPVMRSFFEQRAEFDNLRHDRESFENTLTAATAGTVPFEALLAIPTAERSPGAIPLKAAFTQLYTLKSTLAIKQQTFTDNSPEVTTLASQVKTLQTQTIPTLAREILLQLKEREGDYESRIAGASKELRSIPPRTIQEMALTRAVKVAETLYIQLKERHAEATLAEASATPDVRIHDPAVAPLRPQKNTAPKIMLMAIAAGIGGALALALLLDRLDGKFRYPEQVTSDLGLTVAGVVPKLPKGGVNINSPEQVMQLVEAFRSLRMHVLHSVRGSPAFAVSSASPADGKSLVSSNLAMSFAEAGLRTILVDGDTRRGALHQLFGVGPQPGLTEFLTGSDDYARLIQPTPHDNLFLMACGRRNSRSPELLSTNRIRVLVDYLRGAYDVVIFDTPPLAAGIDAYAIGAATGNLLMVVRIGKTERRLTSAKMETVYRLPINILGAVLNGVDLRGEFQYYGYSVGYSIEEPKGELVATNPK